MLVTKLIKNRNIQKKRDDLKKKQMYFFKNEKYNNQCEKRTTITTIKKPKQKTQWLENQ